MVRTLSGQVVEPVDHQDERFARFRQGVQDVFEVLETARRRFVRRRLQMSHLRADRGEEFGKIPRPRGQIQVTNDRLGRFAQVSSKVLDDFTRQEGFARGASADENERKMFVRRRCVDPLLKKAVLLGESVEAERRLSGDLRERRPVNRRFLVKNLFGELAVMNDRRVKVTLVQRLDAQEDRGVQRP